MLQCVTHCRFCNPEALHEDQRNGRESQDPDQARGARLGGQFDHRPGRYHVKIWTRAWRHVWVATLLRKQCLYSLVKYEHKLCVYFNIDPEEQFTRFEGRMENNINT